MSKDQLTKQLRNKLELCLEDCYELLSKAGMPKDGPAVLLACQFEVLASGLAAFDTTDDKACELMVLHMGIARQTREEIKGRVTMPMQQ